MKNPFRVRLQILGIKLNDEKEYFENQESFINSQKEFPLNHNGQSLGIYLNRLEYYIKNNYLKEEKAIKGKFIFTFYNYILRQFVAISDLLCVDDNFIKLDGQFFYKDENSCEILIISLKMQIFYQEFIKFQHFLESINLEKKNLEENIQQAKNELSQNQNNLKDFKKKVDELRSHHQIQPQYPQIDIAILYSHPILNQDQKRIAPVCYYEDIQNFKEKISNLKKKVTYLITQANRVNLNWVLKYNPKIIHIISHGEHDSNQLNQYLQFEYNCMDDQVYKEDLQRIMKHSKQSLVFLACCFAGEIAKNIQQYATTIAIDKDLKMLDNAGIYYFQHLYENLLSNTTLQDSHEQAKQYVKDILGDNNNQCCCSHSHRKACKEIFKNNGQCFYHLTNCNCRESKLIKDKLSHLWGTDLNEKCQKVYNSIKDQLKDDTTKEVYLENLNEFAENGILRVCCCELAEKFKDDVISQIQHTESEKFQIFQSNSNQSKIFENVENGDMIEIHKISWEEQYFIAWKKDAKDIYQLLTDNFYNKKENKIIVICGGCKKGEKFVIKFAHQISKYFKFRKLKFYKKNEIDDIEIIEESLQNIEKLYQRKFEQNFGYIFIIKQINQELLQQYKVQLIELNHKGTVILISDTQILKSDVDLNQINHELKNWINTNKDKKKRDYYKILKDFDKVIRKKIKEKLGEETLKNKQFDELLKEISSIQEDYYKQVNLNQQK